MRAAFLISAPPPPDVRAGLTFERGAPARVTARGQVTIPVPGPFITKVLGLLRRGPKDGPPPAYFDVLYLDDELRVHQTGQGNLFVQRRAPWSP